MTLALLAERWRAWRPRAAVAVPLAAAFAAVVVGLYTMTAYPVGGFYDDGVYLVLAKALATGEGYRYLNIPGAPPATHYPPGYPALLAAIWTFAPQFPRNVWLFKFANAVLLGVVAAGTSVFLSARLGVRRPIAGVAALAFTAGIPLLVLSSAIMSEPLFLALLLPTLLLCERAADEGTPSRAMAAGALCGASMLVRSIGVALVPAMLLVLLRRGHRLAAAAFFATVFVILLPWQMWTAVHAGDIPVVIQSSYGTYIGWLADAYERHGVGFFLDVAIKNTGELVRPMRAIFTPSVGEWLRAPLTALLLALAGAGSWRLFRRAPVSALFLAGYLAIVLVWAFGPDRFLLGVWPLVGCVLTLGTLAAIEWARRPGRVRLAAAPLAAAALVFAVSYGAYNARGFRHRWWESAQRHAVEAARPLVQWVLRHTRPEDVIASETDPLVYLYTGRRTVPSESWSASEYLYPSRPEEAIADTRTLLESFDVRYLLVATGSASVAPTASFLLNRAPPALALVDTLTRGGAVFTPLRR